MMPFLAIRDSRIMEPRYRRPSGVGGVVFLPLAAVLVVVAGGSSRCMGYWLVTQRRMAWAMANSYAWGRGWPRTMDRLSGLAAMGHRTSDCRKSDNCDSDDRLGWIGDWCAGLVSYRTLGPLAGRRKTMVSDRFVGASQRWWLSDVWRRTGCFDTDSDQFWWCRIPTVTVADTLTPRLALTLMLGRLGCWLNGCCYGRFSNQAWAFPQDHSLHLTIAEEGHLRWVQEASLSLRMDDPIPLGLSRHPTQIYEALVAAVLWLILKALPIKPAGLRTACLLLLYGGWRVVNEGLRGDNPELWLAGWTASRWFSLCIMIIGLVWLLLCRQQNDHTTWSVDEQPQ